MKTKYTAIDLFFAAFIGLCLGLILFGGIYIHHNRNKSFNSLKLNEAEYLRALNLESYQDSEQIDVIYESGNAIDSKNESVKFGKFRIQK